MATTGIPTYIVQAVRSPVGKAGGGLAEVHPADLGAAVIAELIDRSQIDPGVVDDVMVGNVDSVGPQAGCLARTAWLVADMPEHVPGTTIDRRCGSSQQAVHFAAQAIMSGQADVVVAGGIQSMSQVPMMQAFSVPGVDDFDPFTSSPGWVKRYGREEQKKKMQGRNRCKSWEMQTTNSPESKECKGVKLSMQISYVSKNVHNRSRRQPTYGRKT